MGKKTKQKKPSSKAKPDTEASIQQNDNANNAEDEEEEEEETLIKCNVCLTAKPEGISRCSRCRTRAYCSRECQKSDWKIHKLYCRPRPSNAEAIEQLRQMCEQQQGIDFRRVKRLAKNPTQYVSLEKAMCKIVRKRCMEYGYDAMKNYEWPPVSVDWKLDDDAVWNEVKSLPLDRDGYILSYTTMGQMDRETGFLLWYFTVCSERTGAIRLTLSTKHGRPTKRDLEILVYWTMVHPMPSGGKPARPIFMLLANRWGEENSREIVHLLRDKAGIECHLESREQALFSSHQNNTDPDGYNF